MFWRHGVGLFYALCVREQWKKRMDNIKKSEKIPKWRILTTSFDGMGHISFNLIPGSSRVREKERTWERDPYSEAVLKQKQHCLESPFITMAIDTPTWEHSFRYVE